MSIFKKECDDFLNRNSMPEVPQIFDLLQLSRNERVAKKKAQDAVMHYRFIRKERIRIFQNYIENLPAQKSLFRAVQ